MTVDQVLIDRFNAKWVKDANSECWLWTASKAGKGYGQIKVPGTRTQVYAHILSYRIHKGEIPPELEIRHTCDNPGCVNPEHLLVGTRQDNAQDMKDRGRSLYGERNDQAKLTEEQAQQILQLARDGISQAVIGSRFGVSQPHIGRIVRGEQWAHLSPGISSARKRTKVSDNEVREIRAAAASGMTQTALAEIHGISQAQVNRIVRNKRRERA